MAKTEITLADIITKDLTKISLDLQKFLISSGVTPKSSKITDLIDSIKDLKVMYANKSYLGLIFDENKYIIRVVGIGDFIARENVPSDIAEGYYKLINGKLVLDEQRKNQLEAGLEMEQLLNQIGIWTNSNWQGVSLTAIFTAVGALLAYYFIHKFLPKLLDKALNYLVKIMAKMFGLQVDDVSDVVQKLPIVDDIKEWQKAVQAQNELKLIELKNKIVSPKLTEVERVAYQGMFDKLYKDIGDSMSLETTKVLEVIDEKAKEALKKIERQ